ncbi:MAG TPA: GNAT family N-acetyltransferase [Vicinamibacterales bacterium]|nr:GNAT family N-acetyltransferase [Vicinamibacterales bacterium]
MQAISPPAIDQAPSRVILRDGTVALVRLTTPADRGALRDFFHQLSPESHRRRFFTLADPAEVLIDAFSDSADPARRATLLVLRHRDGEVRPIAVGSYVDLGHRAAEAAFAVADGFQGKGLGTILLERLATLATASGFRRFEAQVLPENAAMLEVFQDSGFEIRSKSECGCVTVLLSLNPTCESVASTERRQAIATVASMHPLMTPRTVAVIGASRDRGSIGHRVLKAIVDGGYTGAVYPINPHATDLEGLVCYRSIADVPSAIDLAMIAVPPQAVVEVVEQCAAARVKSLIVITAGFAETGPEGRALQQRLLDVTRGRGMRMVGPNCMGMLNTDPDVRLNASFSPVVPPAGRVAFSSQSGALGLAILELASERGVGLSSFVSVGNKADVSGNDLLEYWEADARTSVILLYLESFGNPRRFARLARRIGRSKPIVAVKAGRTRAGSRAAGSHTAALAASDVAVDALFHQAGVIRADTIDEMFDIAACLEAQPLPRGRRVGIVTNAGGPGILAVDACDAAGLTIVPTTAQTRQRLSAFLPAAASVGNPVDMVASATPDAYRRAIETVLTADECDALLVIYAPVDPAHADDTVQAIRSGIADARAAGGAGKPVLACLMAGHGRRLPLAVADERIPTFAFPENAVRALARAVTYAEWRAKPPALFWNFEDIRVDDARSACRQSIEAHGDGWLSNQDVATVLGAFGVTLAAGMVAHSAEEAVAFAQVLGLPVAAKLAARSVTHKSDIGAVRLNLATDAAVRRAYGEITARAAQIAGAGIDGVLIQQMVAGGVETMIGISDDPLFGPLVGFGLGGIHVEVLGDVRFRIGPLSDRDADELLHEIKGLPLLQGYRGHPPADLGALRELLLRISRLAIEVPEIAELDLNPVIAMSPGNGCRIVDARIKVRGGHGMKAVTT